MHHTNGVCEYDFTEFEMECSVLERSQTDALGGNCDNDVGECASSPCANGATCTDSAVESEVSFHSVSRAAAAFPAAQRRAVESRWHIVNERVAGI